MDNLFDKYSENWGNGEPLMSRKQFKKAVSEIPFYGYDSGCERCDAFENAQKNHYCPFGNLYGYKNCGHFECEHCGTINNAHHSASCPNVITA